MTAISQTTRPVRVEAPGAGLPAGAEGAPATARVAVLIVTWNRKGFVSAVLEAVARQTYPAGLLDVVVVDNAGTDGTLEELVSRFRPERVVRNETEAAHEPAFRSPVLGGPNTLGFGSLSVVRNASNMGGCGGFNTGFAYVEHALYPRPDYLWLVDDDVDLPPDALARLSGAMAADPGVGLVGSRTVDIGDRETTIETTIYFNADLGRMQDDPPRGHRCEGAHRAWIERVGGGRGRREYHGTMDVDVVSACSMLARYAAVTGDGRRAGVGYWDWRYFIYCDDADWCLRFGRAGWRVVLNLDAVVYHTPWNLKLTPARIYYAQRNRVWMIQKAVGSEKLRRATWRALREVLRDALQASVYRRQFHAEIIRKTALDAVVNRAGKTAGEGPAAAPVAEAFERAGLLSGGRRVVVVCRGADSARWARELRERVRAGLKPGQREPEWDLVARNDVPGPPEGAVIYGGRWPSRLKKQLWVLKRRPAGVVVFDQTTDFPVLAAGGVNIHIDQKNPGMAQVERDGWGVRLAFLGRWAATAARCAWYAARVRPYRSETKYG